MPSAASSSNGAKNPADLILGLSQRTLGNVSMRLDTVRTTDDQNITHDSNKGEETQEEQREDVKKQRDTKYNDLDQKVAKDAKDSKQTQEKQQQGAEAQKKLTNLGKESDPAKLYQKAMAETTSGKNSALTQAKPGESAQGQAKSAEQSGNQSQLTGAQLARLKAAKTEKLPEAMTKRGKFEAFLGQQKKGPKHLKPGEQKPVLRYFKAQAQLQSNKAKLAQLQNQKGKETQELKDQLLQQQGELAGEMAMARGEIKILNPELDKSLTQFESKEKTEDSQENKENSKTDSKAEKSKHLATKDGVDKTQKQGEQGDGQSSGQQGQKAPDAQTLSLRRPPDALATSIQQFSTVYTTGVGDDPRAQFRNEKMLQFRESMDSTKLLTAGGGIYGLLMNPSEAFHHVSRRQGQRNYEDVPVPELEGDSDSGDDDNKVQIAWDNKNAFRSDMMNVTIPGKNGETGSTISLCYWHTQGPQNLNPDGSYTVRGPKGEEVANLTQEKLAGLQKSVFGIGAEKKRDMCFSPERLAKGDIPEIYSRQMMCKP